MTLAEICQAICGVRDRILGFDGAHLFLQQFSEQAGDAGVAAGGFDASPLGDVFFESDGDVAELRFGGHENSVTRKSCRANALSQKNAGENKPNPVAIIPWVLGNKTVTSFRLWALGWMALGALLVPFLHGQPSRVWKAATYKGLVVGTSSRSDVIRTLGKPKYIGPEEDTGEPIMEFEVKEPVPGKLTAYVRHGVLEGLALTPSGTLGRADIIKKFGRDYLDVHYAVDECLSEGGTAPLYENPDGPFEQIEYRSRGIAIVLRNGEVEAIVFEGPPFPTSRSRCSSRSR